MYLINTYFEIFTAASNDDKDSRIEKITKAVIFAKIEWVNWINGIANSDSYWNISPAFEVYRDIAKNDFGLDV